MAEVRGGPEVAAGEIEVDPAAKSKAVLALNGGEVSWTVSRERTNGQETEGWTYGSQYQGAA